MRIKALLASAAFGLLVLASASAVPVQDPKPAPAPVRWQDDPACRMVFFAVLEGLYGDGVPTEVVDLIVPREGSKVEHSFVLQCPLCHPVFEAFRLYQGRRPFASDPGGGDTFGKKAVPAEVIKALESEDVLTRITAMGDLVEPWIERRLALMNLDEKGLRDWQAKLMARAAEGTARFKELRATPGTVYHKNWLFYGGCQACRAVEDVVKKGKK